MPTSAPPDRHRLTQPLLLLLLALLALAAIPVLAAPPAQAAGRIDARLRAELAAKAGETAVFFVQVRNRAGLRAGLRAAARVPGHGRRAAAVGRSLRANADASQAGIRAFLRDRKVRFTSPPGRDRLLPGQPRGRHLRPQLQLVRPVGRLR